MASPVEGVSVLLCDADGTLFPSEEPAFDASAPVVNAALAGWGVLARYSAHELRLAANGLAFRASLTALARAHGVDVTTARFLDDLERWVLQENAAVTAHLAAVLRPDPAVRDPLTALAPDTVLAVVSSSRTTRVDACLESAGLAGLFPRERRFSAQDSLPTPTSKPDPAVYRLAVEELGVDPGHALAVEDAVPGARSAVGAGLRCVGMLCFVPPAERDQRVADLERAGVQGFVDSWSELAVQLRPSGH